MSALFQLSNVSRVLAYRNFKIYAAGSIVSLVGTWTQRIATGWLTWELTGSSTWLGVVAFADLFPAVVVAPFAGVAADKFDRLRVLMYSQFIGALVCGTLTALYFIDAVSIWVLLFVTLVLGTADAFLQPFRLAIVTSLVPKSEIAAAVALKSVVFNLARFIGPAVAGVVIAGAGVGWAFMLNSFSFLILFMALQQLRLTVAEQVASKKKASVFRHMLEGLVYSAREAGIGLVLALLLVSCLTARPVVELLPGWAGEIFGGDAADLAKLASSIGAGAVLGGLWLAVRSNQRGLVRVFLACCLGLAASLLVFAVSKSTLIAVPLLVLSGFFMITSAIAAQTIVQLKVREELRGRVLSIYGMIIRGGPAFGALFMGFAAEYVGLRWPLIAGTVVLLGFSVAVGLRRKTMEDALAD